MLLLNRQLIFLVKRKLIIFKIIKKKPSNERYTLIISFQSSWIQFTVPNQEKCVTYYCRCHTRPPDLYWKCFRKPAHIWPDPASLGLLHAALMTLTCKPLDLM